MPSRVRTVSYTHLDVYKRQVPAVVIVAVVLAGWAFPGAGTTVLGWLQGTSPGWLALAAIAILTALGTASVSYTHLDVYKRQSHLRWACRPASASSASSRTSAEQTAQYVVLALLRRSLPPPCQCQY